MGKVSAMISSGIILQYWVPMLWKRIAGPAAALLPDAGAHISGATGKEEGKGLTSWIILLGI